MPQGMSRLSQADSRAWLQAGEVARGVAMRLVCRRLCVAVRQAHACTTSSTILLRLLLLLLGQSMPFVFCTLPTVMIPTT